MLPNLHIVHQWRYRENFYEFFKKAWHVIEPTKPLIENWHLRYIADTMQAIVERIISGQPREHDYIFNMPPGSTKSNLITVALPAWAWIVAPSFQIISTSYADTLAHHHAGKSRDIILSDWYQSTFGDIFALRIDVNKKSEYANNKSGMRYAVGSGASPIGRHADLVLCDDPLNPRKSASQDELQTINNWWDTSISTRLTNANISTKVIVMQRLATNDLSGHCLAKGNYKQVCLPAECTPDVQPPELAANYVDGLLDPVRLDRTALAGFKLALGTSGYTGQMLQSPMKAGGNIVQESWFGRFGMITLDEDAHTSRATLAWQFTLDTAYTENEDNDATALMAYCIYANTMYVRDVANVYMEMPALLRFIPEFVQRNGYNPHNSKIYIEPKASGLSVAQMMKRNTKLNIVIDKAPTASKTARLNECVPFIESGRVLLLSQASWVKEFIDEVCVFPNGTADNQVDVLTMAARRAIEPERSAQKWHA